MKSAHLTIAVFFLSSQIIAGQEKPVAIYTPEIIYQTTPHDDGNGFTSFKVLKGRKADGSYVIMLYSNHILLKHNGNINFRIDSITHYRDAIKYSLTGKNTIKYEMDFMKYNGSIKDIEFIKLDKHLKPKEFITLQMNNLIEKK